MRTILIVSAAALSLTACSTAIEAVRGKAVSVEQRLRWSNVGVLVVVGIMLWALSNDILRLLGL